jgi:hypothetical protein
MAGRPPKNAAVVREIMAEKMFSDGKGTQIFTSVSRPFIHRPEEKDAKSELRIQLKFVNVGASGKETFDIPVAALPCQSVLRFFLIAGKIAGTS